MQHVEQPGHMLSIEITPAEPGGSYKSISSLTWNDIPGFSIVTGRNGSGKTQLLTLLAHHFTNTAPRGVGKIPLNIKVTGPTYRPEEVGFVPSSRLISVGSAISVAELSDVRKKTLQEGKNAAQQQYDPNESARAMLMRSLMRGKRIEQISDVEVDEIFPDDLRYMLSGVDVSRGLAHVFVAHRLKMLESLERNTPGIDREGRPIGPAPWDILNESLAGADFPYKVKSPEGGPIAAAYVLEFIDAKSDLAIRAPELSSGEQVILQLVLWLFSASKEGVFPKLLILDEPDAHLHPSMTTQFLDVISNVLVKKHGVRVFMTTHSPSTVALAPDGSVFQMDRGSTKITKVNSREDIIAVLTAGLVTVSKASKFCFVEDEADVDFYGAVRDILSDYGPSKDPHALKPSPSLTFIAVSVGQSKQKISGGYSVVENWVNKLDANPLKSTFFGIIDRDTGNAPSERVKVIGRYSFENYLLDPVNIFGLLLENGNPPSVHGVDISCGDEHLLRAQSSGSLQAITDAITLAMEQEEKALIGRRKTTVDYTVGRSLSVPDWVINFRGHDLLPIAQKAFGGPRIISPPRLIRTMRRVRLIPVEIANTLGQLQAI